MRPWVLRALVMTAVYGVGQAVFVALRGAAPELSTLWTLIFLGLLLAVGVVWAGAEVILGRTPEEWSWFRAALAAAPSAGVLTWLLLIIFVDGSGVADLGAALVGRASFTALLIMGSTFVGTRLGWLSLSRRGEGDGDPMLDRDETDPDEIAAMSASGGRDARGPLPAATVATVARVARRRRGRVGAGGGGDGDGAGGGGGGGGGDGGGGDGTSSQEAATELVGRVSPEDDELYRGRRERVGTEVRSARVQPDAAEPVPAERDEARPGPFPPGARHPDPLHPDPLQPDPLQPDPLQPDAARSVATQPDAAPPSPSRPGATEPAATEPAATEPAAVGRAAAGPDAVEPDAVEPETGRWSSPPPDGDRPDPAHRDGWEPDTERPGDRTARFAPPVVAVLPEADPRFTPGTEPDHGTVGPAGAGSGDGFDGAGDPAAARGPRRSVAEAARAARIARAQAQQDEKRGGDDKRRRGSRRRPAR